MASRSRKKPLLSEAPETGDSVPVRAPKKTKKAAVRRTHTKPKSAHTTFSPSFIVAQSEEVLANSDVNLPVDQEPSVDFDLPLDDQAVDGVDLPTTEFDTFSNRSEEVLTPVNVPTRFVDGKSTYDRKARVFWTTVISMSVLATVGWLAYLPFQLSQSFHGEVAVTESTKILDKLSSVWSDFQSEVQDVGGILAEVQAQEADGVAADQWPRAISEAIGLKVSYPTNWHVAYTEDSIVIQDQPITSVSEAPAPGTTRIVFEQHANPEKLNANDWATRTEQIVAPLESKTINDRVVYSAMAGVNAVAYVTMSPDRLLSVHATHANVAAFLPVWQDILDYMEIE